ncbi:MAG TPA: alkyl sulfatase dimerization domain-containing protein [Acidimicrobiia bacterium]|nr:alkyl sulfatase dimerization domain-containing protein [Acidimicrobiia bacterium]
MTQELLSIADDLWTGAIPLEEHHPFNQFGELATFDDDVAFVASFANVAAIGTDDGLVLIDTGSPFLAPTAHEALRRWTDRQLHTAVFTHGHIDHCFGVELYEADAAAAGATAPRVIAHEAIGARFDRYRATAGYNEIINQRQFQSPDLRWPVDYRYPDETFSDKLHLDVGGTRIELHHARGETDDHVWAWVSDRKVLCAGDLFIWASPNCGNPQKVQRYPLEWAVAAREMAGLGAEILLPGHGLPIVGVERVRTALSDVAAFLETLHDQTVAMMNAGARLDEIVNSVEYPEELLAKPYLQAVYDEPEFVVRNIWRLYGGWYDGNPARLKPPADASLAAEVAALAGGPERLAERAATLAAEGDLRLAGQLAEWATQAEPELPAAHEVRVSVNRARKLAEASTMSKGVFGWAASESARSTSGRAREGASEDDSSP